METGLLSYEVIHQSRSVTQPKDQSSGRWVPLKPLYRDRRNNYLVNEIMNFPFPEFLPPTKQLIKSQPKRPPKSDCFSKLRQSPSIQVFFSVAFLTILSLTVWVPVFLPTMWLLVGHVVNLHKVPIHTTGLLFFFSALLPSSGAAAKIYSLPAFELFS